MLQLPNMENCHPMRKRLLEHPRDLLLQNPLDHLQLNRLSDLHQLAPLTVENLQVDPSGLGLPNVGKDLPDLQDCTGE